MSPRIAIVVGALSMPLVGAGLWATLRAPTPQAAVPSPAGAPANEPLMTASPSPAEPLAKNEPDIGLPPESDGPARGTEAHAVFFEAVVAGEARGLASVREALAAARAGGSTENAALGRLSALEKAYEERLERHRKELAHQ